MDADLIQRCLDGAVITLHTGDDYPIDFVLPGNAGRSIVAFANWWTVLQWGIGTGVGRAGAGLEKDGAWWIFRGEDGQSIGHISAPEDDWDLETVKGARLATDFRKAEYLANLNDFDFLYGAEFEVKAWVDAIIQRPPKDPIVYAHEIASRKRRVGRIVMRDSDTHKVAVLAIDEDGRFAVSGTSTWLIQMGGNYADVKKQTTLEDYFNWLAQQNPHNTVSLGPPGVNDETGTVDDIADKAMSAFP